MQRNKLINYIIKYSKYLIAISILIVISVILLSNKSIDNSKIFKTFIASTLILTVVNLVDYNYKNLTNKQIKIYKLFISIRTVLYILAIAVTVCVYKLITKSDIIQVFNYIVITSIYIVPIITIIRNNISFRKANLSITKHYTRIEKKDLKTTIKDFTSEII